ncbi:MAG: beta-lactamase family protein [Clostridiales bacterium]|nr:beta-lactamase family protein [Clostridiales bacterium]
MSVLISKELPQAKFPEEVGVSSEKLLELYEKMEETENHGFMVIRHGKIAAQWFREPYSATTPHIMYSVSKSISALAIGFAVNEGIISLDDKVVDYFPEYVPKHCDENLKKLTLRHLITLTAGRNVSPVMSKVKNDWIKIYMKSKSDYAPGEKFSYVNENFHMALAMLRKATGVSAVEFLTPRLFDPLGIPVPFWETDHKGVEAGGWGIYLSATDLAKIALCFLNNGVYEGKQIIPASWISDATVNHKGPKAPVDNGNDYGYGYGIWFRANANHPLRFDGLFGQIAEIYRDHDAVTVIIGGDAPAKSRQLIFDYFPDAFIDEKPTAKGSVKIPAGKPYEILFSEFRSSLEKEINNKTAVFRRWNYLNLIGFPLSVMPSAATYMSRIKGGDINDVSFEFFPDYLRFSWREHQYRYTVDCGMDGKWRITELILTGIPSHAYSSAKWENNNTLLLDIRTSESVGARILEFKINGRKINMKPSSQPDVGIIIDGVRFALKTFVKSDFLTDLIIAFLKKVVEPTYHGHFRRF